MGQAGNETTPTGTSYSEHLQNFVSVVEGFDIQEPWDIEEAYIFTHSVRFIDQMTRAFTRDRNKVFALPIQFYLNLNPEERVIAKQKYAGAVRKYYDRPDISASERTVIGSILDPDNPANALDHESQHAEALPEDIRNGSFIFIIPVRGGGTMIHLLADTRTLTLEQQFRVFINPKVISSGDKSDALRIIGKMEADGKTTEANEMRRKLEAKQVLDTEMLH